jgi:hypothetical protein
MARETVEQQARLLADENRQAEPEITKVFWFPDDEEVRLVELHRGIPANADGRLRPFYFRAAATRDLPAPSGIALIRPDEFGKLELPPSWGDWDNAVELRIAS